MALVLVQEYSGASWNGAGLLSEPLLSTLVSEVWGVEVAKACLN